MSCPRPECGSSGRGWVWCATLLLALAGCADGDYARYEGPTMGTYYRVTAACPVDVGARVDAELETVNDEMSTYRPGSELSRFNVAPVDAWFETVPALIEVVDAALQLSRASGGAFDVTVGPLVNLWGFGPEDRAGIPSPEAVAAARAGVGYAALETRAEPPALRKTRALYVDLSAIAKGHGVDRVAGRLDAAGCTDYLVDVGGEVRARGVNPAGGAWRIGVEVPDPTSAGAIQRVVLLRDAALATSGDYRNFVEDAGRRYSHTIDPRTGYPVDHALASVTVLHAAAMWADGYATLLSVLGPEEGWRFAQTHDLAVLFVFRGANGFEERYTPRFAAYLAEP